MPRQLGPRFALEAAFLILVAVGAGLLDLRPLLIVLVMGVAWLLVALMEYAASREAPQYAARPGPYGPLPLEEPAPVHEAIVEDRPSPTLLEPEPVAARPPSDEAMTEIAPAAPADVGEAAAEPEPEAAAEPEQPAAETILDEEPPEAARTAFAEERPRMRYRLQPPGPRPRRRWV